MKTIYTIFGDKGTGKTSFAFQFKGKKLCLSFDRKSERIKHYLFSDSPEITVIDAIEKYKRSPAEMVVSAKIAYDSIVETINKAENYDYIIIDGLDKLNEICEMVMRYEYKLTPFQGVPQMTYWKMRKILLSQIHELCSEKALKGVIYTTFVKIEDIAIVDGQIIERQGIPRYFDAIEEETDVLFKTITMHKNNQESLPEFKVKIISSKIPKFKTGKILNVTLKEVV